jgi:hypothetical protein
MVAEVATGAENTSHGIRYLKVENLDRTLCRSVPRSVTINVTRIYIVRAVCNSIQKRTKIQERV